MKKQSILFVIAAYFLLSSCAVVKTNTVKTQDVYETGVLHSTVVANLEVKETRVTGTAMGQSTEAEKLKIDAAAQAIEKASADILVEPRYKIETVSSRTTVTVTGYPATYKNFRTMTEEDKELLKQGKVFLTNAAEKKEGDTPTKKKNIGTKIIVTYLGVSAAVGLVLWIIMG